ncbi:MAG: transketolase [Planctomycetes bacterium]|nr:transketolase [Planctomycetota bacterium]
MAQHSSPSLDTLAIDTIRTLSMDGVQKANSGHPGTPMALAPVVYALWQGCLRYDPEEPLWPDRDRFVLSCGHASMLLYSTLFLAGVKELDEHGRKTGKLAVPLEELQRFRQLDSKTPGHPEYGHTSGVETTTGPLGQGVATSVGMAIAQRWLAARYNQPGFELVRHRVWALCGDGDLMEGISSEAASIAGHLGLSNLCWIYDSNRITIEGDTDLAFTEDVAARFQALGWNVLRVGDANDTTLLDECFERVRKESERPTLILVHSHIGYGAPKKQDTHSAHGEPLGVDEIKGAKRNYGWPEDAQFLVPDGVRERFAARLGQRGAKAHAEWNTLFATYRKSHPTLAEELSALWRGDLPAGWEKALPTFPADAKGVASRDAGGKVLNALAAAVPWVVGGSADLAPSTKTRLTFEGAGDLLPGKPGGRNMHFGIREHAMGAIVNGMALSGLRAYGSTFLVFMDYLKPALRLSSLMKLPVVYVFTHDSIGVGEDGPTHQPIEQIATMRAKPGIYVMRPCDANETAECWRIALEQKHKPSALALTRQALPTIDRTKYAAASGARKGAYVLADAPNPQLILIGTGSEVSLCLAAYEQLASEGISARVVSMPSWELFAEQPQSYREAVLPPEIRARVAVEQATGFGWERWVGIDGAQVCMQGFGASAPYGDLQKRFGFTVENVIAHAKEQLALAAT